MKTKRIIPCLDVKNGHVVKGINFNGIKEVADPVELGKKYYEEGADELVFLDISATIENRKTIKDMVKRVSENIFIPFTVGGGIRTLEDMKDILRAGADKVSLNSAAINNPSLISDGAKYFGTQCIVVAIDTKKRHDGSGWNVYINGGTKDTGIDAVYWAMKSESLGCGEILLTSIDCDGMTNGFDIELNNEIERKVNIPIIASGGCGVKEDFYDLFSKTNVEAGLAASIFHYNVSSIREVKSYLNEKKICIRI